MVICEVPASESIARILVEFVISCVFNHVKLEERDWPKQCSDFHNMQSQFLLSLLFMKAPRFPQEVNEHKFGFLGLKYLVSWLSDYALTKFNPATTN